VLVGGITLDRDLGDALRQAFPSADEDRHARPAPVVDLQPQRHERFDG